MKIKIIALLLLCTTIGVAQKNKKSTIKKAVATKQISKQENDGIFAQFETSKGNIVVQLEYAKTPLTVANFITLAEGTNTAVADKYKGKKFFDGLKFHRVIKDFMIQGGDPDGNGQGGPGYKFKDEFTDAKFDKAGILAMANSGPKTNGSQFFITHKETPWLTGKHTIFGYVTMGQDVVNKIEQNDLINKIVITRKGKLAKDFNATKIIADYFVGKDDREKAEELEAINKLKKLSDEKFNANPAIVTEFNGYKTTPSGLKYIVITEGIGEKPTATSNVKVHYTGKLLDGKVFDSSVERGQPIDFGLNQVIKGWTEGVQLMPEGSKYKFYIPSYLAYGERGAGSSIPANADLIFEVELLKINK